MSPRRFSIPHRVFPAFGLACGLGACFLVGCPPPHPASPPPKALSVRGDGILAATGPEFLAERLQLAKSGQFSGAHERWAERMLLPSGEPPPDTRTGTWSQHLTAAIAGYEQSGNPSGHAIERLAQACDRAGWFREAAFVLERGRRDGTLSPSGEELRRVVENIDRLATGLDSLVTANVATPAATRAARPLGLSSAAFIRRMGFTADGLRAHGLRLGFTPGFERSRPDQTELCVMAEAAGPFELKQDAASISVRRLILDDNAVREPIPAHFWDPASSAEVEGGELIAYHRRDHLRTEAVLLFQRLETAGGVVPMPSSAAADTVLAAALRAASVQALFDRARMEPAPRRELLRRFVIDYVNARVAQGEAGLARQILDERAAKTDIDPDDQAARRLLAVLRFAPLPRLALANALDLGARETGTDANGAARVISRLDRAARAHPQAAADSLTRHPAALVGEESLRELASGIDLDRAYTP
jgi:hypothetical protein